MTQSRKVILFTLLVLVCSLTLSANPRIVDIEKELRNAKTVALVTIESYTDSSVTFSLSALSTEKKVLTARLRNFEKSLLGKEITGSLPNEHTSVYIVVDSSNYVSLFAKRLPEYQQLIFWSPVYTGSECLFNYGQDFNADTLSKEDKILNSWKRPSLPEKIRQCSGKVTMLLIRFYFYYTRDHYETGKILIQGSDILFIPDFADSRVYKIKNKSDFKALNGRRLSAFGKLINDSDFDIKEFKRMD